MGLDYSDFKKLREKFDVKAKTTEKRIQEVVKKNGRDLHAEYIKQAQFKRYAKKPTSTGNLRRSIRAEYKNNNMKVEVDQHTDYGMYVEYGTRKMKAQPYARPAYIKISNQFLKDMQKLSK